MPQPLQITAYVAGSIALARPSDLALDGLLAYQVLRKHFGSDFYSLPDPKEVLYFARLPLEMRGEAVFTQTGDLFPSKQVWYWACSSAQIQVKGRDTHYWNKRFDTQPALSDHLDFGGKVEKILIEQGRYKAYHMPLPTLVCDKVVWYAYGEMEPIADALCPIAAIGKKRTSGNGYVLRWEIEPTSEDYSEWKDDKLMRPIPGPLAQGMTPLDIQHIAYRAPQWHTANQAMCVVKAVRDA
jgi:CRISPR type IV-associated protein Csf3